MKLLLFAFVAVAFAGFSRHPSQYKLAEDGPGMSKKSHTEIEIETFCKKNNQKSKAKEQSCEKAFDNAFAACKKKKNPADVKKCEAPLYKKLHGGSKPKPPQPKPPTPADIKKQEEVYCKKEDPKDVKGCEERLHKAFEGCGKKKTADDRKKCYDYLIDVIYFKKKPQPPHPKPPQPKPHPPTPADIKKQEEVFCKKEDPKDVKGCEERLHKAFEACGKKPKADERKECYDYLLEVIYFKKKPQPPHPKPPQPKPHPPTPADVKKQEEVYCKKEDPKDVKGCEEKLHKAFEACGKKPKADERKECYDYLLEVIYFKKKPQPPHPKPQPPKPQPHHHTDVKKQEEAWCKKNDPKDVKKCVEGWQKSFEMCAKVADKKKEKECFESLEKKLNGGGHPKPQPPKPHNDPVADWCKKNEPKEFKECVEDWKKAFEKCSEIHSQAEEKKCFEELKKKLDGGGGKKPCNKHHGGHGGSSSSSDDKTHGGHGDWHHGPGRGGNHGGHGQHGHHGTHGWSNNGWNMHGTHGSHGNHGYHPSGEEHHVQDMRMYHHMKAPQHHHHHDEHEDRTEEDWTTTGMRAPSRHHEDDRTISSE